MKTNFITFLNKFALLQLIDFDKQFYSYAWRKVYIGFIDHICIDSILQVTA